MQRAFLSIFLLLLLCHGALAQEAATVRAVRFDEAPRIDGILDEAVWERTEPFGDFIQFEPQHGVPSPIRTLVRVGYDENALYIAFECYDPDPSKIAAAKTRRDGGLATDDAVSVFLDTFNDNSNAYFFSTNLLGTQDDGRIADNGRSQDNRWDGAWQCASARTEEGWTAEFAIPFKILKFKANEDVTWGADFYRSFPRRLEHSTWAGPLEAIGRVSQFGNLTGLTVSQQAKRYEFIPYAIAQFQEGKTAEAEAGLDVRFRITSTLGSDLTINPDFATIEADAERINLTRFELQIEEKRPFFLEGAELFSQRIDQFYSRRIGDIPWGAKLNGKLAGWDVAFIGAQSDPAKTSGNNGDEGDNATYSVIRGKRTIFGSSNIGFLAANRRWHGEDQGSIGMDATLFFTDTFGMTAQFVRAHGPQNDGALAWFVRPSYDSANAHFHLRYSNWDEGLRANMNAVGFVSDDNRKEFDTNVTRTFWLNRYGIERIQPSVNYNFYYSQSGTLRSWDMDADLEVVLSSKWEVEVSQREEFKRYEEDFRNRRTEIQIGYNDRAGRAWEASYGFGRNYGSDLRLLGGEVNFKITDAWNASYELTKLWLDPDPEDESTWIHSIRSNYYFNTDFYLKLFLQTNSVIDKRNAQVVLVWRFIPPFGSLQLAYQYGSSKFGVADNQGHTLFTKLSWVF
ncbi:MAG TPA: DUF5916 domain-containing protein [Acidobacteriota bacterium]|nr:DUF5916 domain-containing protein [Acidobacteriota bacterium]